LKIGKREGKREKRKEGRKGGGEKGEKREKREERDITQYITICCHGEALTALSVLFWPKFSKATFTVADSAFLQPRSIADPLIMTKLDASSYIIVGAGVFGASTAYHLIRKYPSANVLLIDRSAFPCQSGASWDWNKAIRADYGNILYMEKALEAMEWWRADPLFAPFYHETGLVWVDTGDLPRTIMENYQHLKAEEKFELRSPEDFNTLFDGLHRDADYSDIKEVFVNYSSGWAEASKAMAHVIEETIVLGVQYQAATVEAVLFDAAGNCTGVLTTSGETLTATHIILATGAATPKMLADSAPEREEMQAGDRITAAAICESTVQLSPEDAERFRKGPVFVHEAAPTQGSYKRSSSLSVLTCERNT
jgi:sarcosine oxidase/L-pipecolate oxidase